MEIEIVRKGLGWANGEAWLVRAGDEYFAVSRAYIMIIGMETLVFPANEHGIVTNWNEVAGGRGDDYKHEDAIEDLKEYLAERDAK